MATKVFKYGLLAPTSNKELCFQQIRLSNKYYNTLIEIERGKRDAIRLLETLFDKEKEYHDLNAKKQTLNDEIKKRNSNLFNIEDSKKDSYKEETSKLKLELLNIKTKLKLLLDVIIKNRKDIRKTNSYKESIELLYNKANELQKSARKYNGLYWTTGGIVDKAVEAACKATPLYDGILPNNPRFKKFSLEGRLGGQIQNSPVLEKIFNNTHLFFKIDPLNELAFLAPILSEKKKYQKTIMHLRLNSFKPVNVKTKKPGREVPVWASFPMIMHRPLPEDCKITNAVVNFRKVASKEEWTVDITVDFEDKKKSSYEENSMIALDLGWRKVPEGIRIGKTRDKESNILEIKLSDEIISSLSKVNSIKSIRDTNFNNIKKELLTWLQSKPNLPNNFVEKFAYLNQWKSIDRFAKVVYFWKNNRFAGDEDIFLSVEKWRYHDFHLWNWEKNQQAKSLRRRKEFYRIEAAKFARKYNYLVIEDFDLSKVAKNLDTESEKEDNKGARSNRQLASPHELILALKNTFGNNRIFKVKPEYTTKICHVCKNVQDVKKEDVIHTCSACDTVWDREDNATFNILERGLKMFCERLGGDKNAVTSRKDENASKIEQLTEKKWIKVAKLVAAKKEKLATSRKVEDNLL